MTQIINDAQYKWALERVEELLPLVTDETPVNDPASIELELLSNLVADYSEAHFSIDNLVPVKMTSEEFSDVSLQRAWQ